VRELGKKHKGHLVVKDEDATNDTNQPKQAGYGFQSHGLIIQDHDGNVVFKQADHGVKMAEVTAFVENELKNHDH